MGVDEDGHVHVLHLRMGITLGYLTGLLYI